MLKLTVEQLKAAIYAANQVNDLTVLRQKTRDTTFRFGARTQDDPLGSSELTDIVVPASMIADQIDAKLAAAKQVLADLGIDLQL